MSRRLLIVLAAVALSLTVFVGATSGAPVQMFVTPLNGGEEVPARDTHAHGVAIFQLNPAGTQLSYRLIASNIDNVVQAHIHYPGAAGVNGPVIVWLHPSAPPALTPPTGHQVGTLATGTITAATFAATWPGKTMADLVAALRSGNAYVNVHTSTPGAPAGPGNFPGGEIRGQID